MGDISVRVRKRERARSRIFVSARESGREVAKSSLLGPRVMGLYAKNVNYVQIRTISQEKESMTVASSSQTMGPRRLT